MPRKKHTAMNSQLIEELLKWGGVVRPMIMKVAKEPDPP